MGRTRRHCSVGISLHPTDYESKQYVGVFLNQKWVLLERDPCEDVLSPVQNNHLKKKVILSKKETISLH